MMMSQFNSSTSSVLSQFGNKKKGSNSL
eukprot:UN28606